MKEDQFEYALEKILSTLDSCFEAIDTEKNRNSFQYSLIMSLIADYIQKNGTDDKNMYKFVNTFMKDLAVCKSYIESERTKTVHH